MSVDAFLTRPDLTRPGVFDDGWDTTQRFWGAWATVTAPAVLVDAYYLGLDRLHGSFERGSGHEERHTVGARVVVLAMDRRASLEAEGAYQLGRFQGDSISAWMCVLMGVLRSPRVALRPELALGVGAASGDAGATSRTLGTFNPLFPTGSYFGMIGMNGAPNHVAPRATITLHAPKRVTARAEFMAFWRESLADGVYSVPGFLMRSGAGNPGRYLGAQVEPTLTWEVDRHLSLTATAAYFWVLQRLLPVSASPGETSPTPRCGAATDSDPRADIASGQICRIPVLEGVGRGRDSLELTPIFV